MLGQKKDYTEDPYNLCTKRPVFLLKKNLSQESHVKPFSLHDFQKESTIDLV